MPNRTALAIAEALRSYRFLTLITDAYGGYGLTMEEHEEAVRQLCLVHNRREWLNGTWETQLMRDFTALPVEERKKFLLEERRRKGPLYLELQIFKAISTIYALERELDGRPSDFAKKLNEVRAKQANLMDMIGEIVKKLGEGRVKQLNSGKWQKINADDPLAGASVYWLNHEAELRTFLSDTTGTVPPDSSVVERNIRPLAIIRNNSKFWVSREYAEASLMRLSVIRTLEVNGIDVPPWLQRFCGAVYDHIAGKLLYYQYKDAGEISTKVGIRAEAKPGEEDTLPEDQRKYRLSELVKDFDFKKWALEVLETGRKNRSEAVGN